MRSNSLKITVFCALLTIYFLPCHTTNLPVNVNYLDSDNTVFFKNDEFSNLEVFCYLGCKKSLLNLWLTIKIEIDIKSEDFTLYNSDTPENVYQEYLNAHESWFPNILQKKSKLIRIHSFNQSCLGVRAKEPYKIILKTTKLDFWKLCLFTLGITLFHYSDKLKNYEIFYYISGTSLGILAFLLILMYLASRMMPKKSLMVGVLVGGWSIFAYTIDKIFNNLKHHFHDYYSYLLWYTIITGCISFLVCYRYGPVTNARSRNIIEWLMKALSFAFIYFSTNQNEYAILIMILLIMKFMIPFRNIFQSIMYYIRSKIPKKRRLLTSQEFNLESVVETERALNELREYCKSPKCNQWSLMKKVQNLNKFSSFVEGESHISDQELLEYNENCLYDGTDSDDDSSDNAETLNPNTFTNPEESNDSDD